MKYLQSFGSYLLLMGRAFSRPERMRMFMKQYLKEMSALGVDSIGIVLLISFFIGAVICIQIKLNISSPWMPKFVTGYVTREIMLLEFSSSIMCLILSGKVGSNIASEIGTMRVTQQIDALDIMGVNSANFLILPKIMGMITLMRCARPETAWIRQHGLGHCWRIRHIIYRACDFGRRPDHRFATQLQPLVYVYEYHQERLLCLYHLKRFVILWLYRRGRLG